ncbi:hypothetical protein C8J26_3092 [Sphingomonas aurantiaca]|uniref:Uncharacterized protein n=1 Tax=Sphingomonas aurantiaca TaxID=185949 RepID=A0A2T5GJ40_9SPHN|nr:hypothetical protein [Sphingomonas aurantiaca]PTQ59348.1 hypothetical protein C8J26_3092 [Sphingomonas aurantiaca]
MNRHLRSSGKAGLAKTGIRKTSVFAAALLAATALPGCSRTVSSADLIGFGTAAAALQRQTDANFASADRIARAAEVDRFVRSGAVGLTEKPFPPAVPPDVAAAWRSALFYLERYGLLLGTLTDPQQGAQTTDAFKQLGVELNGGVAGAGISPGVAAAFSSLAGALVQEDARRKALGILRRNDPHVRGLLTAMAEAIGATDGEGLRGTVAAAWTTSTGELQRTYAVAAAQHDEPRQRSIVNDYLSALGRRQAQLNDLAALRHSFLGLADAHSAAADGSKRPVGELLDLIEGRLDEVRDLAKDIEEEDAR